MVNVNIGKGIEMEIDFSKFPPAALDHIMYIGARNILMDSHAGIAKDEPDAADKARAVADKKLAALMSGEVRVSSSREGDPVRAEAVKMTTATIHATIKKAGKKVSDYDTKAIREKAVGLITPEILATAKARVEENRALDAGSLADLGL